MWDCIFCGCRMIAGSLTFCPMCRKDRTMPKITVDGGPTNATAADGEPGFVAAEVPAAEPVPDTPAVEAPVVEVVPAGEPVSLAPEGDAGSVDTPAPEPPPVS